jgi:hypothetical protein
MVMKPIGDTFLASSAVAASAPWRSRALQKASDTSGLRGEEQDQSQQPPRHSQTRAHSPLTQSGTAQDVPLRDPRSAPRLTAAFTAQLLGQILPDPEQRRDVVYAAPALRVTLGLDTKL